MEKEKIIGKRRTIKAKARWENIADLVRAMNKLIMVPESLKQITKIDSVLYGGELQRKFYGSPSPEETFKEYMNRSLRMYFGENKFNNLFTRKIGRQVPYRLTLFHMHTIQEDKGMLEIDGRIRENKIKLVISTYGTLEKQGSDLATSLISYLTEQDFQYTYSLRKKRFAYKSHKNH